MDALTRSLIRELTEAQERTMRRILEQWDREIQARSVELEADARHFQQVTKGQMQRAADAANELANAQAAEVYISGLISQAAGGANDINVAVPTGIRVAGTGGPSIDALLSLVADVRGADLESMPAAQRSAQWALGHGYLPHPGDLSDLLLSAGRDAPWAQTFADLGGRFDALDGKRFAHPQLQLDLGRQRLEQMSTLVGLMDAYSPGRTVTLLKSPSALDAHTPPVPTNPTSARQALVGKVMDTFLK